MKRHYRVIRPAPRQTSIGALRLTEDMERIKMAMECLRKVDGENICSNRDDGKRQILEWLASLGVAYRHAEQRLRTEFLAVDGR